MSDQSTTRPGALAGIRVLDLTRILAGPFCTAMLGDLGADVIKVEQPGKGDDTRAWGPPFLGDQSAYFLGVNRNKRSITLDLKSERGAEILRQLVLKADILVENFKPGTLGVMGLADDWLQSQAPQVIHCSISGYGSSGPQGGKPGYDFLLQAQSGLMSITGEPDGSPMKLGVAIVDLCTGMYASTAILAALAARGRTGRGQRVAVCLYDTGISLLANVAANYLASGEPPPRLGNGHPNIVPYRDYPTRDGHVVITVGNDAQFEKFAGLVGHAEWSAEPRFQRNSQRIVNRRLLDGLVAEALGERGTAEWIAILEPAGIPCATISTVPQAINDPQTLARDMVVEVPHPTLDTLRLLGIPFRLSDTPASIQRPPPTLGEHTHQILRDELQLSDSDIERLEATGVI